MFAYLKQFVNALFYSELMVSELVHEREKGKTNKKSECVSVSHPVSQSLHTETQWHAPRKPSTQSRHFRFRLRGPSLEMGRRQSGTKTAQPTIVRRSRQTATKAKQENRGSKRDQGEATRVNRYHL